MDATNLSIFSDFAQPIVASVVEGFHGITYSTSAAVSFHHCVRHFLIAQAQYLLMDKHHLGKLTL